MNNYPNSSLEIKRRTFFLLTKGSKPRVNQKKRRFYEISCSIAEFEMKDCGPLIKRIDGLRFKDGFIS